MTETEIRAEFKFRTGLADHAYWKTAEPCCQIAPSKHLGAAGRPRTLPSLAEMRAMLGIREDKETPG